VIHHVAKPKMGVGGGDHICEWFFFGTMKCDSFTGIFQAIRDNIDSMVDDWLDLPNPENFQSSIEDWQSNIDTNFALNGNGILETSGSIGRVYENMQFDLSQLQGRTISAFKDGFLGKSQSAIGNFHGITVAIELALNGELVLWERSRDDVVSGFWQVLEDLEKYAKTKSTTNWPYIFRVVGSVSCAISGIGFVWKPAGVLGGMGQALAEAMETVFDETGNTAEFDEKAGNYDTIMARGSDYFHDLRKYVLKEEQLLRGAITSANQYLYNTKGIQVQFGVEIDEKYRDNYDDLIDHNETTKEPKAVNSISDVHLPNIANELRDIKSTLQSDGMTSSRMWLRPDRIGICYHGCFNEWADLVWHLIDLVGDMASKIDDASYLLKKTLEAFTNHDNSIADLWRKTIIEANSGYQNQEPWRSPYIVHSRDSQSQIGGF